MIYTCVAHLPFFDQFNIDKNIIIQDLENENSRKDNKDFKDRNFENNNINNYNNNQVVNGNNKFQINNENTNNNNKENKKNCQC